MILYVDLNKQTEPINNSTPTITVDLQPETIRNMDLADASASTSSKPSDEEIDRLFEEALTSMDLPPAKVRELRNCDMEKKLKIALDMRKTTDFKSATEYLNELAVSIDGKKSTKKKKKLIKQQQTSTTILKHIEISLRTNPIQWVNSFLQPPNNGLTILIEYMAALQEEQFGNFDASEYYSTNFAESKSSSDDSSTLKSSKSQNKMSMDTGGADDIQVLVLCLRAIMNASLGIKCTFAEENSIYTLTKCILHPSLRTKACVYELLSAVCLFSEGHEKIIDAFDKFRVDFKESHRFQTLMRMMSDPVNLNNVDFVAASMQLINLLVHSVEDINYRLYLQQEFTILGLEEFLKTNQDDKSEQLQTQFNAYLNNRIDMNVILPRSERLETVEDKLNEVIKQLSSQREKYQNDLGELSEKNLELAKKLESLISERQELIRTTEEKEKSLRTLERQQFETEKKLRNVEGQLSVEVQRTKKAIENELSKATTPTIEKTPKISSVSSPGQLEVKVGENYVDSTKKQDKPATVSTNVPPAPPPPPMLKSDPPMAPPLPKMGGPPPPPNLKGGPPPPPPPFLNPMKQAENVPTKKVIKTNVKLPAFNWTVMPSRNVKETIFHHLDDEKLVDVLDLKFIENMFGEEASSGDKGTNSAGPPSPTSTATSSNHSITILDPKKLQNIAIMRRKLGKSVVEVMSAIHKLNLNYLNPDEVDILSRMLPLTKEESDGFNQYMQENGGIDGLSSDEQFVWKLQNIERVETKLKLMTFMSEFDGMIRRIEPEFCKLDLASKSVMESKKFQKVLEVLLAVGNAMNAGKNRPLVYGFKISTLSRLTMQKSHKDHNITILHGLVDTIEHSNLECADFSKELNFVDDASTVMLSDVEVLFRGLTSNFKIAEEESARDNPPAVLVTFVSEAKPQVERVAGKLENAKSEFKKCVQLFGEDPKSQTPKDFFSCINDFMQNFEMAHDQLQKRNADKEPKAPRPIIAKRPAQPNTDAQLFNELNSKFGMARNREHKPSSKLPSNQMADGDLERMMSGLKDGYVAPAGKCVRKRPNLGELQDLSAGYREVCRERQA